MRARHWTLFLFLFLIVTSVFVTVRGSSPGRRILHQPWFPATSSPPPPPPETEGFGVPAPEQPFFTGESVPDQGQAVSPPPTSADGGVGVPAAAKPAKKVAIGTSVGIVTLGMLSALAFFLYRHRKKHAGESRKLVGDGESGRFGEEGRSEAPPPASFLYVGTVEPPGRSSGGEDDGANASTSPYHKLGSMKASLSDRYRPSPELQPLPPLDPIHSKSLPATVLSPPPSSDEDTAFFTPQGTPGSRRFHPIPAVSGGAATATVSVPHSKRTNRSLSAPPPPPPPIPINHREKPRLSAPLPPPPNWALLESKKNRPQPAETIRNSTPPPPPPPPPPALPSTPKPTNPIHREEKPIEEIEDNAGSSVMVDTEDTEGAKPRLKPLHWDKVRATSDRATVWDQLKSSSFQLNEDMMETLFGCSTMNNPATSREPIRRSVLPPVEKENMVLDPKKSQNIAILLRALNVTQDKVSEALLDGDPESLGVELLESLVKMAPTKEEEIKLRDYNGDVSKLGSAERFFKAVLDIPFAFKRVEAMLYRGNFDSEVKYLRSSFQTLEAASEELKNSRLFLKLLEAVLRTGNRMNVGTNRGDAKSFKLDTLLKLVDIKGADGKTTLLHFVVQEIIRTEGENTDSTNQISENKIPLKTKEEDFRKQGLQVVAGLGRDLTSVKKAAGMDSDVLSSYVSKLETGLEKVTLVLQHEKTESKDKFLDSMKLFLKEAGEEISQIKEYETKALSHVKDVTRYFHGNAAREEPHPLRIFMIVRDFLSVLDNVCKEVGRMQDRTMVGSARSFRRPETASLPVLNRYNIRHNTSSDEENSSP